WPGGGGQWRGPACGDKAEQTAAAHERFAPALAARARSHQREPEWSPPGEAPQQVVQAQGQEAVGMVTRVATGGARRMLAPRVEGSRQLREARTALQQPHP